MSVRGLMMWSLLSATFVVGCERGGTQVPADAGQGGPTQQDGEVAQGSKGTPGGAVADASGARAQQVDSADPSAQCHVEVAAASETMLGRYPSLDIRVSPPIQHHGGPVPALHVQVTAPSGEVREQDYGLVGQSTCAYCLPAPGSGGCEHSCTYQPYEVEETTFGRLIKEAGTHQLNFSLRNLPCALNLKASTIEVAPKAAKN